ncbi:MAG: hypothetical protein HYX60_11665 [Legionella longbeachae]|nr:hypothetical protein [Legionella longbeachae]
MFTFTINLLKNGEKNTNFHWLNKLPQNLEHYENSFIYIKDNGNNLLYDVRIRKTSPTKEKVKLEKVVITDFKVFETTLQQILPINTVPPLSISLPNRHIKRLIQSNGGYTNDEFTVAIHLDNYNKYSTVQIIDDINKMQHPDFWSIAKNVIACDLHNVSKLLKVISESCSSFAQRIPPHETYLELNISEQTKENGFYNLLEENDKLNEYHQFNDDEYMVKSEAIKEYYTQGLLPQDYIQVTNLIKEHLKSEKIAMIEGWIISEICKMNMELKHSLYSFKKPGTFYTEMAFLAECLAEVNLNDDKCISINPKIYSSYEKYYKDIALDFVKEITDLLSYLGFAMDSEKTKNIHEHIVFNERDSSYIKNILKNNVFSKLQQLDNGLKLHPLTVENNTDIAKTMLMLHKNGFFNVKSSSFPKILVVKILEEATGAELINTY